VGVTPTGAESRPYIAAIRSIEVPPGTAQQARLRRPGATAQDFMRSKPRLRILAVGINLKSGIRAEVGCGPFPNIADHLTAAKGTVAGRRGFDTPGPHCPPAQVRVLRFSWLIPQRKVPFPRRQFRAGLQSFG